MRLVLEVEAAVDAFPRKRKFGLGQEIRDLAYGGYKLAEKAWLSPSWSEKQHGFLGELIELNDELKRRLNIAREMQAFSKARFQHVTEVAVGVGRQATGWRKSFKHPKGQNSHA